MDKLKREDFLKMAAMLAVGSLAIPKFLFSNSVFGSSDSGERTAPDNPQTSLDDTGIIDLHCHPSLKMYLWNRHIWRHHCPGPGTNFIAMQDDVNQLSSRTLKGLVVSHYLVEASAEKDWDLLKKLFPVIKFLLPSIADKIEHEDYSNFTQINIMIDTMESQVHLANQKQDKIQFIIARDFGEFEQALKDGKLPIAHAIEGAHALGRNLPISKPDYNKTNSKRHEALKDKKGKMQDSNDKAKWYIQNLEALKGRGVCMITIGHIFSNDIAFPTEGISPDEKHTIGMDWAYTPEKDNLSLTEIGEIVVRKMLDIGIIVDLTHCAPAGRDRVFAINKEREKPRPLTFTHVGAQTIFDKYDKLYNKGAYHNYNFYNISDPEIDKICECDGVIGVIPENFWLIGCDTHLKERDSKQFRYGINYIVETMQHINSMTRKKDYSNVAIGTDFDGLADAPHDLYIAPQLNDLVNAMYKAGITADEVKRITHQNATRLLRNGWGS